MIGHDPWKQDEAYSFGIIYNMYLSGDLVVPTLAGDPFMEKPPAYYITATGMVHLFSPWLELHDAARLTSALYLSIALLFAWLLGRETWGQAYGPLAAIALVSCLGLLHHGHFMITDTSLLAGMTMAYYGLLRSRRARVKGGLLLGTGAGLAFLSKGLLGPGILGLTALLLPASFRAWRSTAFLQALGLALLAALPWLLIWPAALYLRSPELFMTWFWDNNFGRYLGFAQLGPRSKSGFWWKNIPWITFPALPLALWTLWRLRRSAFSNPGVQLGLTLSLVIWLVLTASATARDLYALPALPVLALIGAGAVLELPRPAVTASYWFSLAVFGLLAAALWVLWVSMLATGQPPQHEAIARLMPMDFTVTFGPVAFVAATALTLAWLGVVGRFRPPSAGALLSWPVGLTLVWGIAFTLHLPWLDYAKSYRAVFVAMNQALPPDHGCVADIHLRESERGMAHYVAGLITEHIEAPAETECPYILVETKRRKHPHGVDLGPDWKLIWTGHRSGDHSELFFLFQRISTEYQAP